MFNPEGLWDASNYLVSVAPLIIIALPLIGSLALLFAGNYGDRVRNPVVLAVTALTMLLVAAQYPLLARGPLFYSLEIIEEFKFILKVDYLSFFLSLLFSLIWFLAALFGTVYFAGSHAKTRFYVFFLSSLGHALGVVLAGDLLSFFLFFELMTLSSFVLFIHNQTPEALKAGILYIFMGIMGGLSLLAGLFLIYHATGSLEMVPLLPGLLEAGANVPLIVVFFLLGFGIKMGMVPLHIWMPKAYAAAPSPVNALSSAVMLKVGAYGLIRVLLLLTGPDTVFSPTEPVVRGLGLMVLWLGVITMVTGALMALFQSHGHRILACSSISQMGYIMVGIGTAAYLGVNGAMGYAGAMFHMANHAFLKGGLFLLLGALYLQTRELDTSLIKGAGRRTPFLMGVFLLASFGMGGVPGFNGYISKTLLHHALVKAYELQSDPGLWVAEKLFMLGSALTVCYFIKFFLALFGGEGAAAPREALPPAPLLKGVLAVFGGTFLALGLFPNFLYEKFILPSLGSFAFDPANIATYLEGINFFAGADLLSAAVVLALGTLIYALGSRYGWSTFSPPSWMSVEAIFYGPAVRLATYIACRGGTYFDGKLNYLFDAMGRTTIDACKYVGALDGSTGYTEDTAARRQAAAGKTCDGEDQEEERKIPQKSILGIFKWTPGEFNIKNINFDTLLLAFMLAIFLMVLVYMSAFQ